MAHERLSGSPRQSSGRPSNESKDVTPDLLTSNAASRIIRAVRPLQAPNSSHNEFCVAAACAARNPCDSANDNSLYCSVAAHLTQRTSDSTVASRPPTHEEYFRPQCWCRHKTSSLAMDCSAASAAAIGRSASKARRRRDERALVRLRRTEHFALKNLTDQPLHQGLKIMSWFAGERRRELVTQWLAEFAERRGASSQCRASRPTSYRPTAFTRVGLKPAVVTLAARACASACARCLAGRSLHCSSSFAASGSACPAFRSFEAASTLSLASMHSRSRVRRNSPDTWISWRMALSFS